jgi:hypothetical protein
MSFENLVEKIILEGLENGEFSNLEGEGQPVDLESYFLVPQEVRAGYTIMKNARVVPLEMELLREVNEWKEKLAECSDEQTRVLLQRKVNDAMLRYNLQMDAYKRKR